MVYGNEPTKNLFGRDGHVTHWKSAVVRQSTFHKDHKQTVIV